MDDSSPSFERYFKLFTLILAGEVVFLLPFVVTRIFRPVFLEVFDITNFELGSAFSLYGIVAMVSYFFGGPLADRYSPRKLVSFSLLVTSLGGIIMAMIPSILVLTLLYGFWGVSTILLFWAAFTKATRASGGANSQGNTFGLVDGGRGLVAALLASASVLIIGSFLPENVESATGEQLSFALSMVILLFSLFTLMVAGLVWFSFKDLKVETKSNKITWEGVKAVGKKSIIWKQAIILMCAYVGYKCTDDFSLFASDVLNYDNVDSAHLATIAFWTRPIAAVGAGLLGDRFIHSKIVVVCFGVIIVGSLIISLGILKPGRELMAIIVLSSTSAGIFGLRGLYYALLQEAKIPMVYTGSAVGLISVIGFTPDIFFGPLMGYILDGNSGASGHEILFGVLTFFGTIGLLIAFTFKTKRAA